jgi:hypothetical protein
MKRLGRVEWVLVFGLSAVAALAAQEPTRGVGVYPGDPSEDFAPALAPDAATYRNLALRRPAYHSSSYDYNLTAQLVTDGIKETKLPRWVVTATSQGGASRVDREALLDHNVMSTVVLDRAEAWAQIELAGGDAPLEIDRIELEMRTRRRPAAAVAQAAPSAPAQDPPSEARDWTWIVSASDDGETWREAGRTTGTLSPPPPLPPPGNWLEGYNWFGRANPPLRASISLVQPTTSRFFRISVASSEEWALAEVGFYDRNRRVEAGGPYHFDSAWMSEGKGEEWVYVDLGARCTFDRVALYWIRRAAEGAIQASDDAIHWTDLRPLPPGTALTDDLELKRPASGRYVRVLMKRPASPEGYVLSELEVYGRGGLVARPKPAPPARADGRLDLAGGAWRLQRDSLVSADGAALSKPGFKDADWVVATVPATVLSSYWNAGALPDPNFGDNQFMISDSFFYADFWYRTEFTAPRGELGRRTWLNFDGVNWKADVFLNGEKLGRVEGAFTRGRFDVSGRIRPGKTNALAVRIEKNATPGSVKQKTFESAGLNGGALGADNPTYHASIGWDWIPTVRGRNIGIWNDVYLTTSGPVTLESPLVTTTLPLPDTSRADVRLEVSLNNHEAQAVNGTLRGHFGDIVFEQPVALDAASSKTVVLDPSTHPALRLSSPKLWWPNGYGDPNLYDVELAFVANGQVSDATSFRAGVRQFTYSEEGGALKIWINGRRFVGRGGNWGFPETNLRYRRREYDTAVRYHRDMNFTMIRNWVGQTDDDEFYDACDKYGIVVWQDFWLANPADGPEPDDSDLFLRNARDFVLRLRNHPSMGLYCGRNEGNPPEPIDGGLRSMLAGLHADVHYISNSASGVVSGGGPYGVQTPSYYFQYRATTKLHSELGMPNIVTIDSLRQMLPESALWPPGLQWGLHDFNLNSAQRLTDFRTMIDDGYGGADNAADWVTLAQFVNYDGYRAMFEAQGANRMGVLLWMSHPAWPSFVWQTYDYYFEPTAGYFGAKKGSEPLHIQWNSAADTIEVVNYSGDNAPGLTAHVEVLNLDGSLAWEQTAAVDSSEDSIQTPIKMQYPAGLTPVHFIRLKLTRGDQTLSENFYWRGRREGNFKALRTLPKATVEAATRVERQGDRWILTSDLHNASTQPALLVRLKVVREKTHDRILPAMFSDNYVALMPDERRTIRTDVDDADTRGEAPTIVVGGFNIADAARR